MGLAELATVMKQREAGLYPGGLQEFKANGGITSADVEQYLQRLDALEQRGGQQPLQAARAQLHPGERLVQHQDGSFAAYAPGEALPPGAQEIH
jgi:hypothetical protein